MLAIAWALMSTLRLLLLDKPPLGLAPTMVAIVFRVIAEIRRQGMTVLMVEQNAALELRMADGAYVMESGRIAFEGAARDLLDNADIRRAYSGG
jgi:branched-chain amino acid transport system ATP-binding protein